MKRKTWSAIILIGMCFSFAGIFAQDAQQAVSNPEETSVQIQQIEPYYYCCVEMTGSYDQHAEAFGMLYSNGGEQSIPVQQGIPFGIYYNSPATTSQDSLRWEIGVALSAEKEAKDPLKIKKWEHPLMASKIYEGPFDDQLSAVYQEIYQWITENQYREDGPLMEKYLADPTQNADGEWVGRIEILVPVAKVE